MTTTIRSASHRGVCLTSPSDTTTSSAGDKYKVSAQITVVNLANEYALYNFLSTFSGTHYVTPRSITAQLAFHF